MEKGALKELKRRGPGRNKRYIDVAPEDLDALEQELREKEMALAEMSVLFNKLKKKKTRDRRSSFT